MTAMQSRRPRENRARAFLGSVFRKVSRTPAFAGAAMLGLALAFAHPAIAQTDRAMLAAKLEILAEKGNAEAAYHLGMMKHLGLSVAKDETAALTLFRKAAEGGDPLAEYKIGELLSKSPDLAVQDEALKWKVKSAEAGYALAQYDIARALFLKNDLDGALEWLTRAAQQGHPDALRALASLHNSDAMPKDAARTFAYYTLYLQRLAAPTEAQKAFLTKFVEGMSADDKTRGEKIVADWKVDISPVTAKAQAGLKAAEALEAAEEPEAVEEAKPAEAPKSDEPSDATTAPNPSSP